MPKSFDHTRKVLMGQGLSLKEAEAALQERMDRFSDSASNALERMDDQANSNSRTLTAQLVTLATLLITVTGIFISQQDIFKILSANQKLFILTAIISFFISVICGVIDYLVAGHFFNDWSARTLKILKGVGRKHREGKFRTFGAMQDDYHDQIAKIPHRTSTRVLETQLASLLFGGIAFILVLIGAMFDFNGTFHHLIVK